MTVKSIIAHTVTQEFLSWWGKCWCPKNVYAARVLKKDSFMIAQSWKQPKRLSTEWIDKLRYIHTADALSEIRRDDLLTWGTAWLHGK